MIYTAISTDQALFLVIIAAAWKQISYNSCSSSPACSLPATLVDGGRRAQLPDESWLELAHASPETAPAQVNLGVRPEDLTIGEAGDGASGGRGALKLAVELSEPLGAESLVHGRLVGTEHGLTLRVAGSPTFEGDEVLEVSVDPARLHLFDEDTAKRLS